MAIVASSSSSSSSSSMLAPPPPPSHLPSSPSDAEALRSLLRLSREISLSEPPRSLPTRLLATAASRRCKLLSVLFEELLRDGAVAGELPRAASLCLAEILLALQRFKSLLADCAARSRFRLLLEADAVAAEFHELSLDLATLLDILPAAELAVAEDVRDLVDLARRQCRRSTPAPDPAEDALRSEVLKLIREIEMEIVPDRARLAAIFELLGLDDSPSCRDEIELLEREIGDRAAEKWTSVMVALVGLLRYAKCVLYGASTPRSDASSAAGFSSSAAAADELAAAAPRDFRCPISLDLMRDPVVVVATGQTYDRASIATWFASGHATCPKTGQVLPHLDLVPNRALKNLISRWCQENRVPFDPPASSSSAAASASAGGKTLLPTLTAAAAAAAAAATP
uniref:RING-type E3 ubiquitin transferase n=1 Tax=Ananas comosus var. bracteatus TaxID=296719 RepID=A0A6V7NFV7_ANACO|nr:unnamed protein product [Ananas comosus var. bracteatus]